MGFLHKIKPAFWHQRDSQLEALNYRRLWKTTFGSAVAVTLAPLLFLAGINFYQFEQQYQLQHHEIASQIQRLLTTSKVQVSDFLEERRAALAFVNLDNTFDALADHKRLNTVFRRLRKSFGGFVDMGLIDAKGIQQGYVGPYNLQGRKYEGQDWYHEVIIRGIHVSDVFLGHRNFPHFVIAVRHENGNKAPYILRATIDTGRLNAMMKAPDLQSNCDLFLINKAGVLQTPSRFFGGVLANFPLLTKGGPPGRELFEARDASGRPLAVGMAEVENTPFILVAISQPQALLQKWELLRINVIVMVGISVVAMLAVIWWGINTLVERIYEADLRRAAVLHEMEYTNKLASIGRLAAGVAHEINNPVAVINEKVGLMNDLLKVHQEFPHQERFLRQTAGIKDSVRRVSEITHRLLGFARHLPVKTEEIHLEGLLTEVLGLLGREAEYRNINISLHVEPDVPPVTADKGQLQQVFLNIINNALAAVDDGGEITISVAPDEDDCVAIKISDNGMGIDPEDVKSIFEPFFSTKGENGTGLGLSITYGIVQKLGGHIEVASEARAGTTFTVTLPQQRKAPVPGRQSAELRLEPKNSGKREGECHEGSANR